MEKALQRADKFLYANEECDILKKRIIQFFILKSIFHPNVKQFLPALLLS